MMEFILFLAALAAITVVGHLLWLACAAVLRAITGKGEEPVVRRRPSEEEDRFAAERLIRVLVARRKLDSVTAREVLEAMRGRARADHVDEEEAPAEPRERPLWQRSRADEPKVEPSARPDESEEVLPVLEIIEAPPTPPVEVPTPPVETPVRRRPVVVEEPVAPAPPRRSWTETFAGFMEERNILWGELVGGLLIVGCSIALVIYLWKKLEEFPYFPVAVFGAITLAMFGAGLYTFHRWKLHATSRGLLVISMLLVPLNLLVLAGLGRDQGTAVIQLGASAIALGVSVLVVRGSGRVVAGPGADWLVLGVVGASAAMLLTPLMVAPGGSPLALLGLACLPVACQGTALWRRLRRLPDNEPLERQAVLSLMLFLGVATFAVGVALAFLLARGVELNQDWQPLALPLAIAGAPVCLTGLALQRRLREQSDGGLVAVGIGVALTGMTVQMGAVLVAWPDPLPLLAVCLFNAVVLTWLAFRQGLPWAHHFALPCLVLATALLVQIVTAGVASKTSLDQLLSSEVVIVVVALVPLLTIVSELVGRWAGDNKGHSWALGRNALAVAALTLPLALRDWNAAPVRLAWVYALCGLTTLAGNLRWQRRWLSDAGYGLLLVATFGTLHAFLHERSDWWGLVLASEALLLAVAALQTRSTFAVLTAPCQWLAHAVVGLALLFVLMGLSLNPPSLLAASTLLTVAGSLLVAAWGHGRAVGVHFAALALWAAVLNLLFDHASITNDAMPFPLSLLVAGTLLGAASWLLTWLGGERLQGVYAERLSLAGEAFALAAPPALLVAIHGQWLSLGLYLLWAAAPWLASAWRRRSPAWFAAFQTLVYVSVASLAGAWIEAQGWTLSEPRAWHTLGITLAGLSVAWVGLRLLVRRSEAGRLLDTPGLAVDRGVTAVLVGVLLLVGAVTLAAELGRELAPSGSTVAAAFPTTLVGGGLWALLGVLALALLMALWDRRSDLAVVSLLLLALSLPVWTAHLFLPVDAPASALRWGLALTFLACSLPLWGRQWLVHLAQRLGMDTNGDRTLVLSLRVLLLVGALAPVLLLTLRVAQLGFAGLTPAGPGAETIFARLDWVANNVVPLAVLCLGLVGHAVRERSAGYAFWAGQLANISLVGGYALAVVASGGVLDVPVGVRLLQLGTLGAALWGLGWMLARPWVHAWREDGGEAQAGLLMTVQMALAAMGQLLLWLFGLGLLGSVLPLRQETLAALGSPLGWAALLALALVPVVRAWQGGRTLSWHGVGAFAVSALVLLACSLGASWPEWGPRSLMLGSALLAVVGSLGRFVEGRSAGLKLLGTFPSSNVVVGWVVGWQVLAVLLGLQATPVYDQPLWGAAAIGGASLAGVLMGTWRREEGWALASGLGVNLAASLVVWHFGRAASVYELRIWMIQVNLAASAAVSLLWLLGQRHLRRDTAGPGLLLGLQTLPVVVGHTLFLLLPLAAVVEEPGEVLTPRLVPVGDWGGWATLALVTAATLGYAWRWLPGWRPHALGLGGVSVGVLAAVVAERWPIIEWPAYHTLMVVWGLLGLGFLVFNGWTRRAAPGLTFWVQGMALALSVLAVHVGRTDPLRPWTTAGAALLASVLLGGLAPLWQQQRYVYASGLAIVLAGVLWWLPQQPQTTTGLELTMAASLALGSVVWLALAWPLARRGFDLRLGPVPYPYIASLAAVALVAAVTAQRWLHLSLTAERLTLDGLELPVFASVTVALLAGLRGRNGWFAVLGLYALTLCGLLHGVERVAESVRQLHQASTVALTLFLLACSLLSGLRHRAGAWLPAGFAEQPYHWFTPAQLFLALWVIGPSLPLSLTGASLNERLLGPLVLGVLVLTGVAMLLRPRLALSELLVTRGTLAVAVLAVIEVGWAFFEPDSSSLLLRRTAVMFAAVTAMALVYLGLARLLPGSSWQDTARRYGDGLPFLGWGLLPLLLVMEVLGYDKETRMTALGGAEAAAAAVGIVLLTGLALRWALVPRLDPLGARFDADGTAQGRTLYVYLSELFLVGLFLHVRLNAPWLFSGAMARYWPLTVMLLAYIGTGVGELFQRRGQHVLGGPLRRTAMFLPLLPLLAFWIRPPGFLLELAQERAPGLVPILKNLDQPFYFDNYAFVWLMLGGLYLGLSLYKRSLHYALFAALAGNVAYWCLLGHRDLSFLVHPQMWLIPLAVILLVTEHLSREHLNKETSLSLRYGSLLMIYVSSTADLFIAGLGNSVWLPVVLATLCVLGMLSGIMLRVRAFLFVSVSFLCLVIFVMIWHAASDRQQTWVWYVSGIVLGSLILALFAVFEKRREDVLHLLDQLKTWE